MIYVYKNALMNPIMLYAKAKQEKPRSTEGYTIIISNYQSSAMCLEIGQIEAKTFREYCHFIHFH